MIDLARQKGKNDLADKADDMLFEYGKKLFYDKDNVGNENESN